MRFTAFIAATMALAGSAAAQCHAGSTANCDADSAIRDAMRAADYSNFRLNAPGTWDNILFHCNDDYTLKVVKQCSGAYCVDGGTNKNDYCAKEGSAAGFWF